MFARRKRQACARRNQADGAYIVVLNPRSRWLPQWARARLGERYLAVDVFPLWTPILSEAKRFVSAGTANLYLYPQVPDGKLDTGRRRPGYEDAVIRGIRV